MWFDVFMFLLSALVLVIFFFFFNDTATTEIYTLSLHDALPILGLVIAGVWFLAFVPVAAVLLAVYLAWGDRKSTRLNSSHGYISYAVFCLKKKNNPTHISSLIRAIMTT